VLKEHPAYCKITIIFKDAMAVVEVSSLTKKLLVLAKFWAGIDFVPEPLSIKLEYLLVAELG
jgi:hypothetical protein